jgi:TRAP-type C4-dicarboxylate transport system substrate-binding protein
MVSHIMIDEFPSFQKELAAKNMFVLLHNATALLSMISKVQVPDMADVRGKRMRIFAGEFHAELTKLQGASPVMTPWPEVYESLDKGIVDCMVTVTTGMRDLKLYEVSKYLYLMKISPDSHWVAPMNACYLTGFSLKTFKRLPVQQRVIVLEEAQKAEERYARLAEEKYIPEALAEMKKGGMNITDWPKTDVVQWGEIASSVYKMASDKMNSKNLPGDQMVKRYLELTKAPSSELRKLYDKAWAKRIEWAKNM